MISYSWSPGERALSYHKKHAPAQWVLEKTDMADWAETYDNIDVTVVHYNSMQYVIMTYHAILQRIAETVWTGISCYRGDAHYANTFARKEKLCLLFESYDNIDETIVHYNSSMWW